MHIPAIVNQSMDLIAEDGQTAAGASPRIQKKTKFFMAGRGQGPYGKVPNQADFPAGSVL